MPASTSQLAAPWFPASSTTATGIFLCQGSEGHFRAAILVLSDMTAKSPKTAILYHAISNRLIEP